MFFHQLPRIGIFIGCICVGSALALSQTAPAPLPEQPHPETFAAKFQPFMDNHFLAGAVFLIATKDRIIDEETMGYADLESKKPMSIENEFWIASMTKTFTSTALMMLADEGKLSVDDPVEKYLPEFKDLVVKGSNGAPPVPASHPILIREILSHTSGMANIPDDVSVPLAEHVRSYPHTPLENQPGTKFLYTNAGINTAGRIVEVVAGMPYEKFVQDRILTPLGMTDTSFWPNDEQLARLATAYRTSDDGQSLQKAETPFVPQPGKPPVHVLPAGGLFSTASDVLKFCRMLLGGGVYEGRRYISEASLATMTKMYTTPATGGSYGLGMMVTPKSFGHDGAFMTRMTVVPGEGLVEIFLVQVAPPSPKGAKEMQRTFTHTADDVFGRAAIAVGALP